LQDQLCSQAAAAVLGMNINFFEMYCVALDQLGVRKTYWNVVCQGDPQVTFTLSLLENVQARRLGQDRLRREPRQQLRGGQLNR
jgi:hypothetical protein